MIRGYIILSVFVLTIGIGFFTPTPLDDLKINLNLNQSPKGYEEDAGGNFIAENDVTNVRDSTCTAAWLQKNQGVKSKVDKKRKRIIGGTEVLDWKKWPWTASLRIHGENEARRCGGVLISCNHIVTALHCLYDITKDGEININKGVLPSENVSISLGSTKYMHGTQQFIGEFIFYKKTGFIGQHPRDDIAVVEMAGEIKTPTEIHPILLPTRNVGTIDDNDLKKRSTNFWVTGWGDIPKETDRLKQINQLKLRPGKICKKKIVGFNEATEICVERFPTDEPKAATCYGDSGSPGMVQYTNNHKWHLQAVVSSDDNLDCTKPGFGALANVFYYKNDIEKIMDNIKPIGWTIGF